MLSIRISDGLVCTLRMMTGKDPMPEEPKWTPKELRNCYKNYWGPCRAGEYDRTYHRMEKQFGNRMRYAGEE